jgi:beta-N-acetylhexosaminidase
MLILIDFLQGSDNRDIKLILSELTVDQKIGQLFMVTSVVDEKINQDLIARKQYRIDKEYIQELISKYHVGGVVWLGRGHLNGEMDPEAQKNRSSELREYAKQYSQIPLWFGQDLEPSFLGRFGFGTVANAREIGKKDDVDNFTFEIGKKIGKIAVENDVQLVLAPVVDIHKFDQSPITKDRSFGSSGEHVVKHAVGLIDGMVASNKNVVPCIKHFPGHGATVLDSHVTLPTVEAITNEMLFPFKQLLKTYQTIAVMVGHIAVKDCNQQLPATFNSSLIEIAKEYNKNALIITDALDMCALQGFENKALRALQAGCHLLLCSSDVPKAISEIKQALVDGSLSMDTIDKAVEKILKFKFCY